MKEGPSPFATFFILITLIVIISLLFSVLKVFFLGGLQGNIVEEEGAIEVIFCPVEDCEQKFVEELINATQITCALYDINIDNITKILRESAQVIIDERNADEFPSAYSKGYMHHKVCVLDERKVITGSMNPTKNGAYKNDNNLIVIESKTFALRYKVELNEILKRKSKRYIKEITGPHLVNLSGDLVALYFCPQESCEQHVIEEINKAKDNIRFMMFSFTSDAIGDALIDASDRGVQVEGVFEKRQKSKYSEYEKLKDWGIPVLYDGNSATMHHKVFVIDNETVITGSYNPTKNANERNDENLLIIHNREIAAEFSGEFDRVRTLALSSIS